MTFDQILIFFHSQNEFIIYGIVILASFIENFFPPFPGDMVTVAGAIIASEGNTSYIGVSLSAIIGGLSGAMLLYYLGRLKGRRYFERSRFFGESGLMKVESLFSRFGDLIIILSRFIVGVRSAVSVAAGLGNVRPARMIILTTASFIIWNGILLGLVFFSKSNWEIIAEIVSKYHFIIITVLLIAAAILISRWIWKKRS